jgi:hypothetical protein
MENIGKKIFLAAIGSGLIPFSMVMGEMGSIQFDLPTCNDRPHSQRISLSHLEGTGVGFNKGYSTAAGFFSLPHHPNTRFFADLRAHVFNDGKWAANAGIGWRRMIDQINAIAGVNLFYDFRQAAHTSNFHQLGPGLELLFKKWDIRANGYFTVTEKAHRYQSGFDFSGHNVFFFKKYEQSMQGADLQVGRELFRSRYVDMHASLGGYYFGGPLGRDAAGGLLRVSARITPYFSVEGQTSYDRVFRWRGWGTAAINFPFGARVKKIKKDLPCSTKARLEERFVESVPRSEIIVVDKHVRQSIASSPITGLPLNFIVVDNVLGASDGTFEHPYATLLEAQENSSPGDVIYVFPGDGTSRGMNQGILLQNNQTFISAALPVTVETAFGTQEFPAQSSTYPLITNINPSGITVDADNTTGVIIEGFQIAGTDIGISGVNASSLQIAQNRFVSFLNTGIDVTLSSNATIEQNSFVSPLGIGIDATSSTSATVQQNNFNASLTTGIVGTSSTNFLLSQNDFFSSLNVPISAEFSTNFTMQGNNFFGAITNPIDGSNSTNFTANQNLFSSFLNSGFNLGGSLGNLSITGNTLFSNGQALSIGNGIPGTLNATITGNSFVVADNSGSTAGAIFILTGDNISDSFNISGNDIQIGQNWYGIQLTTLELTTAFPGIFDITINENTISSSTPTTTNNDTGVLLRFQSGSLINLTMLSNLITNMGQNGLLINVDQSLEPLTTVSLDIESNQFLNVATAGTPLLGGVDIENPPLGGSPAKLLQVKLYSNICSTDQGGTVRGYYINTVMPSMDNQVQLLSPTGTLAGISVSNPGPRVGTDTTSAIGSTQVSPTIANVTIVSDYPPTCNCP